MKVDGYMIVRVAFGVDGKPKKVSDRSIKSCLSLGVESCFKVFLNSGEGTEVDKIINFLIKHQSY